MPKSRSDIPKYSKFLTMIIVPVQLPDRAFCDGCPFLTPKIDPFSGYCGYEICSAGYHNYCYATTYCIETVDHKHPRPFECIELSSSFRDKSQ
jgi:hypothetical protein